MSVRWPEREWRAQEIIRNNWTWHHGMSRNILGLPIFTGLGLYTQLSQVVLFICDNIMVSLGLEKFAKFGLQTLYQRGSG
jgi:hypothetical protein